MLQRYFGLGRTRGTMSLFALSDCSIEMSDRFFGVGISIGVLSGPRFDERFLGVVQEGIGMPCVALHNGLLGVPNSFVDMIFLSQRNLRHQKQSEAETQHGDK
jgi:hypothetical protein